jgi:hypothetical protein
MDSASEGLKSEIARQHGVDPKKVGRWAAEGMPLDATGADEWLRVKRRGRYSTTAGAVKSKSDKESSALAEILAQGTRASPGVTGIYHRAAAIEAACFTACLAEPTAANVTAHARARASLVEAEEQVEGYHLRCRNLIDSNEFRRLVQAQDGCSVALITSMPFSVVDLIVGQPREVVVEALQGWGRDTYLKKRRETDPFGASALANVDVDAIFDEADEEAGKDE